MGFDPFGTVRQGIMETMSVPASDRRELHYPVRGQVVGVKTYEIPANPRGITVVDVAVAGTFATILPRVPILSPKLNALNGETWSPEVGDSVLVSFIEGRLRDPIVLGCLAPQGNALEAQSAEAPQYHKSHQGTSETITKTGRRILYVSENEEVEIVGDGTVEIGGNLTVTVTGDATLVAAAVNLGSSSGLQRLIDERFAILYDVHTHTTTSPGSDTGAPKTLLTPLLAVNATTKTKAV